MSVLDRFSLAGKVAYVTGSGQGIGYALAQALAEAGADVALADINTDAATAAAAQLQEETGRRVRAYHVDVTDPARAGDLVFEVAEDFGGLDIAFHNAGFAHNQPAEELTVDNWNRMIGLNLSGAFYGTQAAGRYMLTHGGGSIVNTASMSAHVVNVPQPQVHYNASKAGVIQLSRSFAVEWAQRGVRVNTISPGYIGTELLQSEDLAPLRQQWEEKTPQGRIGRPDELQGIAVYLASEASSYATGADFVVDGGYTAV